MDVGRVAKIQLDGLVAVLEDILYGTIHTRKIFHETCEETQYLLSNWQIPNTSTDEMPQDICQNEIEDSTICEVVKNIDYVVEQAQKLRDKLSPNLQYQSKKSYLHSISFKPGFELKQPSLISDSRTSPKTQTNKLPKTSNNLKLCSGNKQLLINNPGKRSNLPIQKRSRPTIESRSIKPVASTKYRLPPPVVNGNCEKKEVMRRPLKSMLVQTTYQKDFSLRKNCSSSSRPSTNSTSNIKKNISAKHDNAGQLCCMNTSPDVQNAKTEPSKTLCMGGTGLLGLEELLSKVTIYPNVGTDSEVQKVKNSSIKASSSRVPEDNKINPLVSKPFRTVELEEAMDVLGVPSDLVKVLKTYHCFLKENGKWKKSSKGAAAAKSFLDKLSSVNETNWSNLTNEPLIRLFSDYFTLVAEVSRLEECDLNAVDDVNVAFLQEKLESLENKYRKLSNISESVFSNPEFSKHTTKMFEENLRSGDGWAMLGVWNMKSRQRFKAIGELECLRYKGKEQWKKFSSNMQELQKLDLQMKLFEVMESDIFPQLSSCNPQDSLFPALFKAVCSLCNMAMLSSPLLVKSS